MRTAIESWAHSRVGSILLAWDFLLGLLAGLALLCLSGSRPALLASFATLLPVLMGVFATLIGFVIAAHAVMVGLITDELRRIVEDAPGGVPGLSRPYKFVAAVAGAALFFSIALALSTGTNCYAGWEWRVAFATLAFLATWAIIGALQLVWIGAFLFESRQALARSRSTQ